MSAKFSLAPRIPDGKGYPALSPHGYAASGRSGPWLKWSADPFGPIWRQTARQRLEAKRQQVKQTLRARMHVPVPASGEWLGRVLAGFYPYHAVPVNWASLDRFRERLGR
jgi:hypothetical protein